MTASWTAAAHVALLALLIYTSTLISGEELQCNEFGFICVNCTSFRLCPDVGLAPAHEIQSCVPGFQCNMGSDLICDINCEMPEFECYAEGRFPDPLSCKRYYICSPNLSAGGFHLFSYPCPGQSLFDPQRKQCTNDPVPNCS